jgi:hypothetical protein
MQTFSVLNPAAPEDQQVFAGTFIVSSECDRLHKLAEHSGDWAFGGVNKLAERTHPKLRRAEVLPIEKIPEARNIHAAATVASMLLGQTLSPKFALKLGQSELIRYAPGDFVRLHADAASGTLDRAFSVLTYLNEGFYGGETMFPLQGLKILPRTGLTLFFSSHLLHESTTLVSGSKYAMLTFIHNSTV